MEQSNLEFKDVKIVSCQQNNGQLNIVLENQSSHATCPNCGTHSNSVKNYRTYHIIHPTHSSAHFQLFVRKRCFRCCNSSCNTKYFTEQIYNLKKKHIYTQAFETLLENLYKHMDLPTIQKHLFDKYNLSVPLATIWHKLKDKPMQFQTQLTDIQNAKYIGLDEFSYAKGNSFGVLVVNIDKRKIADMVAGGRNQKTAEGALSIFNPNTVEACAIDMCEPFKNAIQKRFPNALIVIDKFHVIQLLNDAFKELIKRILPSLPLNDSQSSYFNKCSRWILLRANETLSNDQRAELPALLSLNQELNKIYEFKELFRNIYKIKDINSAHSQFHSWLIHAKASHIPELVSVANTYSEWFTFIFNYWHCPISNAITEGKVHKIKVFRRKAYHYKNFHTLRYQVLKSEQYNFKS